MKNFDNKEFVGINENEVLVEYTKEYMEQMGILVRGEYDEDNLFTMESYVPFLRSTVITSSEDVSLERHAEKQSFAGICDDIRVGVSLIFYVQNIVPYLQAKTSKLLPVRGTTLSLSGLSCQGTVLMPIVKNEYDREKVKRVTNNRSQLIAAARSGDEDAMESLTLEDIDTYTTISRKIHKEDVFSLVDTYFMPYGVECDHYAVLGEIVACQQLENPITDEKVYVLNINCNELLLSIAINQKDILGQPLAGRRFKGIIWLQGYINFPD